MIIRPAGRADIAAWSSALGKPTLRAWVAESDGVALALGGYFFHAGRWYGFCDLADGMRPHKVVIARTARRIIDEARRAGISVLHAVADPDEPGAEAFLAWLGFRFDERTSLWRMTLG